mmetsp:Transcript_105528/g.308587  ORF Transcript_105528/g.308587 Transcript_105528/m.308587 type:complete len:223 (-) Transcript_105528:1929-2597(-)
MQRLQATIGNTTDLTVGDVVLGLLHKRDQVTKERVYLRHIRDQLAHVVGDCQCLAFGPLILVLQATLDERHHDSQCLRLNRLHKDDFRELADATRNVLLTLQGRDDALQVWFQVSVLGTLEEHHGRLPRDGPQVFVHIIELINYMGDYLVQVPCEGTQGLLISHQCQEPQGANLDICLRTDLDICPLSPLKGIQDGWQHRLHTVRIQARDDSLGRVLSSNLH